MRKVDEGHASSTNVELEEGCPVASRRTSLDHHWPGFGVDRHRSSSFGARLDLRKRTSANHRGCAADG
jgi:hypothetical protein